MSTWVLILSSFLFSDDSYTYDIIMPHAERNNGSPKHALSSKNTLAKELQLLVGVLWLGIAVKSV